MRKIKYAIEMGGAYTCIYVNGEGLALKEATLIAAEPTRDGGYKVVAMGNDAKKLIGKTNARAAKMLKKREKDVSVCCISEKIRIFAVAKRDSPWRIPLFQCFTSLFPQNLIKFSP